MTSLDLSSYEMDWYKVMKCPLVVQISKKFLLILEVVFFRLKGKGTMQIVSSADSKAFGMYEGVLLPIAWVTCTSVTVPLMLRGTTHTGFGTTCAATQIQIQKKLSLGCKTTFFNEYKSVGTGLACLFEICSSVYSVAALWLIQYTSFQSCFITEIHFDTPENQQLEFWIYFPLEKELVSLILTQHTKLPQHGGGFTA